MKRTPLKRNSPLSKGSLNKGGGLKKSSSLKKNPISEEKKEWKRRMREFFEYMWTIRKHYSEVSGAYLGEECKSIYQHHILPKSTHKEAAFDPENIIFLTADEHAQVEHNPTCFEEVNRRLEQLKIKYDKNL